MLEFVVSMIRSPSNLPVHRSSNKYNIMIYTIEIHVLDNLLLIIKLFI